jgi:hypothetical protein
MYNKHMDKKIKIEFAPGAFDSFQGTQEELDQLIAEIQEMANTGELFEKSQQLDIDELIDEDPEFAEAILRQINEQDAKPRKLQ